MSDGLEHEDGGTDADVEGVETPEHRDADVGIGSLAPLLGKSCRFSSHHDGRGWAHVVVVIFIRVLQLGCKNLDVSFFEEGDALLRGTDSRRHREDGTDTGPDQVGVIKIRQWVADDDRIYIGCIRTPQDRPQVTGLLYAFQDNHEWIVFFEERGGRKEEGG